MVKIIAFGASTSSTSINKTLVAYATELAKEQDSSVEIEILDFTYWADLPLFNVDLLAKDGISDKLKELVAKLKTADKFIVSVAENSQSVTTAFLNLINWASQVVQHFFNNKPMLLISTSPGAWGGQNARDYCKKALWYFGADVYKASWGLPSYYDNFAEGKVKNEELNTQLTQLVGEFLKYEQPEGFEIKPPFA